MDYFIQKDIHNPKLKFLGVTEEHGTLVFSMIVDLLLLILGLCQFSLHLSYGMLLWIRISNEYLKLEEGSKKRRPCNEQQE